MQGQTYRAKVTEIYDNGFVISGIGDEDLPYKLDINHQGFENFDPIELGIEIGTEYNIVHEDEIKFIKIH